MKAVFPLAAVVGGFGLILVTSSTPAQAQSCGCGHYETFTVSEPEVRYQWVNRWEWQSVPVQHYCSCGHITETYENQQVLVPHREGYTVMVDHFVRQWVSNDNNG
jgi:hypothetical protein